MIFQLAKVTGFELPTFRAKCFEISKMQVVNLFLDNNNKPK